MSHFLDAKRPLLITLTVSLSVLCMYDVYCTFVRIYIRVSDPYFFFADPDPGKNLHADPDPDPDPGGIRGRGLGVKGKNDFFFLSFFSRFR